MPRPALREERLIRIFRSDVRRCELVSFLGLLIPFNDSIQLHTTNKMGYRSLKLTLWSRILDTNLRYLKFKELFPCD